MVAPLLWSWPGLTCRLRPEHPGTGGAGQRGAAGGAAVAGEVSLWSGPGGLGGAQVLLLLLSDLLVSRNLTDVMLHLVQPRFRMIFGEHYYRQEEET